MKEKLTLKELAPYLPYKLKILDIANPSTFELSTITINLPLKESEYYKPILRPLSELTEKEINNIDFSMGGLSAYGILNRIKQNPLQGNWNMLQYLFENHFDVFGLIEKGLAININNIKL